MPYTRPPPTTVPTGSCHSYQFTCLNSYCVSYYDRCDGVNDCGDMSDEYNCCEWEYLISYDTIQITIYLHSLLCQTFDPCQNNRHIMYLSL